MYQLMYQFLHGSLNVPIEHHPTIRYMVYNGFYRVMSNIPKMGQLPTPVLVPKKTPPTQPIQVFSPDQTPGGALVVFHSPLPVVRRASSPSVGLLFAQARLAVGDLRPLFWPVGSTGETSGISVRLVYISYHIILYYIILYHIILYYNIFYIVLYYIILYYITLYIYIIIFVYIYIDHLRMD